MVKSVAFCIIATIFLSSIAPAFPCTRPGAELPEGCRCFENPSRIDCEISVLDISAKLVAVEAAVEAELTVFDELNLHLRGEGQGVITANTLQRLQFGKITFTSGRLATVDENAFPSTYETTDELSFVGVQFSDLGAFPFFRKFTDLRVFQIIGRQSGEVILSKIPDSAFDGMQALQKIAVTAANVTEIGNAAFDNLLRLEEIDLSNNSLSTAGIAANAFSLIRAGTTLILDHNAGITHLEAEKFETFLDTEGNKLSIAPRSYGVQDYHLTCDDKIHWICDKARDYEPKLEGYYCKGAVERRDVFDYCNSSNLEKPLTLFSLLLIFGLVSKFF